MVILSTEHQWFEKQSCLLGITECFIVVVKSSTSGERVIKLILSGYFACPQGASTDLNFKFTNPVHVYIIYIIFSSFVYISISAIKIVFKAAKVLKYIPQGQFQVLFCFWIKRYFTFLSVW